MLYLKNILQSSVFLLIALTLAFGAGKDGPQDTTSIPDQKSNPTWMGEFEMNGLNNSITSDWIYNYDWADWYFLPDSPNTLQYFVEVPELTDDLIESGMFLVYVNLDEFDATQKVQSLPYVFTTGEDGNELELHMDVKFVNGGIYINTKMVSRDSPNDKTLDFFSENGSIPLKFRYVLIPSSKSGNFAALDYDKMTYEDAITELGLSF